MFGALALLVACVTSSATTQTISGCGSTAIAKADAKNAAKLGTAADCFRKAAGVANAAEAARRAQIAALSPAPAPSPTPVSTPTPTPTPAPAALAGILAEGDSISIDWGGSYVGIGKSLRPALAITGKAVGGSRITDTAGGNGLVQRFAADKALKPAVVTIFIGANDLGDGSYDTPQAWLDALWAYVAGWKATGAKVAVATVLPQCNYDRHNQRRAIVNPAIRAAVGSKIDGVLDFAADDALGPDAAACDKSLYKDGLHPTDGGTDLSGGEGRLARIYIAGLDALSSPAAAVAQPAAVTPIASNFDRSPLIVTGYDHGLPGHLPPSMSPDVVGAFRFICTAGQMNYDDPILYPGVKGGSPHLHQWYGNTGGNYASTYGSLRASGDSTCSNMLNRSAYWVPALMSGAGKVIQPDYLSIYYKRLPDGDPMCLKESAKGCVGIPTGLRVVSGYDMKRMGEAQPQNDTFTHRCISPGKTQVHRKTLAEAVADCGGSGQIMTAINFGNCWNGELDSADHRSHLTHATYRGQAYAECPASHPYIIPELTQQIAYTIAADDGDVWFSSDRMNGMTMTGGTTFHADYMEGWDPQTRDTWTSQCIGKMLNCSDGELGDGTMLKRGPLPLLASPRLVDVPTR
nr:DUF1996 domain-containing protein [Sphingomonas beigongshangi]